MKKTTFLLAGFLYLSQICFSQSASIASTSITCATLGAATVQATSGTGPYSYTWTPTAQTGSVANGLKPGSYTITIFDLGNNFTYTVGTVFTSFTPLSGTLNKSSSVTCNGATTGTANYIGISGGSGSQNYMWTNGTITYTNATVLNLGAGSWTAVVTDALTDCTINNVFLISQPPVLSISITPATPTACVSSSVTLTGSISGGSPGYTYSWTSGPSNSINIVSSNVSGTYVYTLNAIDANTCTASKTVAVTSINNPVLSVSNVSVCPLVFGTLTVSGATSYTWSGGPSGNTFTASPTTSSQYTVTGSALGCTAIATASIIVIPAPSITLSSNSPVCSGQTLLLNSGGGALYLWTGPSGYTSAVQNPFINQTGVNNSGSYNLTVTAANSCTAAAAVIATVNPIPSVSASGSSLVCAGQSFSFSASSPGAVSYSWSGPVSFTSALQTVSIGLSQVNQTGVYIVVVTGANSCTNSAQVIVNVNSVPGPTILPVAPLCAGASLTLFAAGGQTYFWSGPSGFTTSVQNPVINSAGSINAGNYSLTVTAASGCSASAIVLVTVNPLPSLLLSLSNGTICSGESATITVNGAQTYSLNGSATGSMIVVNPLATTVYTVYGSDANLCSGTVTTTVLVEVCIGIRELTGQTSISIFPNPAQDAITVKIADAGNFNPLKTEIINSAGQLIKSYTSGIKDGQEEINISDLSNGFYILKIAGEDSRSLLQRFVVAK